MTRERAREQERIAFTTIGALNSAINNNDNA
jgi:hypothetical protein